MRSRGNQIVALGGPEHRVLQQLLVGGVAVGDAVVTEGLDGLKPGADVQIFGAPPEEQPADKAADAAKAGN